MPIRLKTDFRGSPPRPFRHSNGKYYIRLRYGGKDIWRSCKTTVKKEAEAFAYEIWFQHQKDDAKIMLQQPSVFIDTVIDDYKATENFRLLKNSTKQQRIYSASAFIAHCHASKRNMVDDLTPEFCESYLSTRGKTGKTFNNLRSDLIKVFDPVFRRLSAKNPFESVPQRITSRGTGASKPKAAFTDEQIRMILDAIPKSKMKYAGEWLKACKVAMYTGLRYEDIALLRYDEITDDILELKPKKTESRVNKKIIIRVPPELQREFFSIEKNTSPYLFPHLEEVYPKYDNDGKRISGITSYMEPFMSLLRKLNITAPPGYSIGFHSFRVTLVTKLREAGYSSDIIRGLVGHTNKIQTEHYNRAAISIDVGKIKYG